MSDKEANSAEIKTAEVKTAEVKDAVQADSIIENKQETPVAAQPVSQKSDTDWVLINLIASIIALLLSFCGLIIVPICFILPSIGTLISSIVLYSKTKEQKAMIAMILSGLGILVSVCSMCLSFVILSSNR